MGGEGEEGGRGPRRMVNWWPSGGEGGAKTVMSDGGWFRLVVSDLMHLGGGNLYFLFPTALDTAFGQENHS